MTGRRLDSSASLTAQFNAMQRAAESMQPRERRMVDDPYAKHFVSHPALRAVLVHPLSAQLTLRALDRLYGGLHGHITLRARYAEDLRTAAAAQGIQQLVLLGAGFDSAGLHAERPLTVYEVDAATTQNAKRNAIENLRGRRATQIIWTPCDFEHDAPRERLVEAGFDPGRRCLVVWLGVTFYLTRAAIERTLGDLAALCAAGSLLLLDYGEPGIVDGTSVWPGSRRGTRLVARFGEPYRSGFTPDQIETLLRTNGFAAHEHLRLSDLAARYAPRAGAWCSLDDWPGLTKAERI